MESKTSITLSRDLVDAIDDLTPEGGSRSETIEQLLRESFAIRKRRARDRKDLEAINKHSEQLNEEAGDAKTYQVDV